MQRSFKSRLEALERLEALADARANPGELTADDCALLVTQIALCNVTLEAGRARRQWATGSAERTAEIDQALLRLNALLAVEPDPPASTAQLLDSLAQYVPDDALPLWIWGVLYEKFPE